MERKSESFPKRVIGKAAKATNYVLKSLQKEAHWIKISFETTKIFSISNHKLLYSFCFRTEQTKYPCLIQLDPLRLFRPKSESKLDYKKWLFDATTYYAETQFAEAIHLHLLRIDFSFPLQDYRNLICSFILESIKFEKKNPTTSYLKLSNPKLYQKFEKSSALNVQDYFQKATPLNKDQTKWINL